jgi:hypothetical protein
MRKLLKPLMLVSLLGCLFSACKKDNKEVKALQDSVSPAVLSQIKALAFSTQDVKKVDEGYVVEKDILLRDEDLNAPAPNSPAVVYAEEEQYRTFNLVNAGKYPVIKVAMFINYPFQCKDVFSLALDEAIRRYNAENLTIKFQRVDNGANINIFSVYQVGGFLGLSGFPFNYGAPYNKIYMNTYWFSPTTINTNVNWIASIMAHELGHCIGFRHTDFFNRALSCGGAASNEDQVATGVGAVHIPGTPVGYSANSWMLACIGILQNRLFTPADKVALNFLY